LRGESFWYPADDAAAADPDLSPRRPGSALTQHSEIPAARTGIERRERVTSAALIMLCQSMQALAFGGIALFLPLIRTELGLTFTEAGSLAAAATLVYAVMQLPSGYLADRVKPKRLFVVGLTGTNLLTLLFARLHTYWMLVANQAVTGFFRALVFAPGLLLMSALFPPRRRATALGLYIAGGFSSNIVLNSLGPVLVGPLGWRTLFTLFAAGGLTMVLVYSRLGSPGPEPADEHRSLREALQLFRYRAMWLIALIQYVRLAVVFGIAFWLPTYIVDGLGYSLQIAGLVVAIGGILTAVSNFVGGYVSDRLRNPLLVIGTAQVVLAMTAALLVHAHNLPALIVVVAVNAFFVQFYFGPLFAVPIEMFGPRTAGLASGFGNFFANVGGFTFTYTLGALKDATGSFAVGFYSLSVLCLVGLLGTVALSRVAPVDAMADSRPV